LRIRRQLDSRIETGHSRFVSTKFPRYFDVIRPVSGPFPDCFLSILQSFAYSASIHLTRSKTDSFEGKVTELW
jgi:hypothetical protein